MGKRGRGAPFPSLLRFDLSTRGVFVHLLRGGLRAARSTHRGSRGDGGLRRPRGFSGVSAFWVSDLSDDSDLSDFSAGFAGSRAEARRCMPTEVGAPLHTTWRAACDARVARLFSAMSNSPTITGISPKKAGFAWPTLELDRDKMLALTNWCTSHDVGYKLGAKAPWLGCDVSEIRAIDCSGFVRYLAYQASSGSVVLPDGSVNQHEAFFAGGFKRSSVGSGRLQDGILRIAFLRPEDGDGVGHVAFLLNGRTLESHGHHGPDRRLWTGQGWMGKCSVYVVMV